MENVHTTNEHNTGTHEKIEKLLRREKRLSIKILTYIDEIRDLVQQIFEMQYELVAVYGRMEVDDDGARPTS